MHDATFSSTSVRETELSVEALGGLWRRSLLAWPDGRRDGTSRVTWLQGPSYYVDLRQPAGRPELRRRTLLRALTPAHLDWLATQEGFAGELRFDEGTFHWARDIDFQPVSPNPDRGHLRVEEGALIEEGLYLPYTEHWHREAIESAPFRGWRLIERSTGCRGFLVRGGGVFMYARERRARLLPHIDFRDQLAGAASIAAAQDLVDCEISEGTVTADGWIIRRSSLPYREGCCLAMHAPERSGTFDVSDLSAEGRLVERCWDIVDAQGAPGHG